MDTDLDEARRALKAMSRAGYELMPLKIGTKVPRDNGWREAEYFLATDIAGWVKRGGNVGVRLRDTDLVLDVDPRSFAPGDDPLRRLCHDVGADLTDAPSVVTGRGDGGMHLYFSKPAGLRIVGKLAGYQGIDFRSAGAFVVAPGSRHPETGGSYVLLTDITPPISDVRAAPDTLLALIARGDNPFRIGGEGAGVMSNEQLAEMLAVLDPVDFGSGHYDSWIALAAACHDATAGGGLIEFLNWCAGDPVYADEGSQERVARHWESFEAGRRGGATFRSLLRAVADAGRPDLVAAWESDALLAALDDYDPDHDAVLDALREADHG